MATEPFSTQRPATPGVCQRHSVPGKGNRRNKHHLLVFVLSVSGPQLRFKIFPRPVPGSSSRARPFDGVVGEAVGEAPGSPILSARSIGRFTKSCNLFPSDLSLVLQLRSPAGSAAQLHDPDAGDKQSTPEACQIGRSGPRCSKD